MMTSFIVGQALGSEILPLPIHTTFPISFNTITQLEHCILQMERNNPDFYQILSLSPGSATPQAIKAAFRKHILQHHPDKQFKQNTDRNKTIEKTHLLIEAYKVLSSPELKKLYDESLKEGEKTGSRHFELLKVNKHLVNTSIDVEFQCEQCYGENNVQVQLQKATEFIILCQHCGLRSRLVLDAESTI